MYEEFTQNRIAQLRLQKNISARDMSLSLGQNNSYINQIENKKSLPSLQGLFYICEFLGITPQQFFDDGNAYPAQLAALVEDLKKLDAKSLEHIAAIVKELVKDVKKKAEGAKVAIRNIRRDANDFLKKANKNGDITEDELKTEQNKVQKETDKYIKVVDEEMEKKSQEILTV